LFGTYWYGLELPRHLFHFSPASIRHLMTAVGFEEVQLTTPSVAYVERSLAYIGSSVLEKMGCSPIPVYGGKRRSLLMRIIRKALRLLVVAPLAQLASLAGAGPSMQVVFRKASECKPAILRIPGTANKKIPSPVGPDSDARTEDVVICNSFDA